MRPRHLAPAATPLTWEQWRAGWSHDLQATAGFAVDVAGYLSVPAAFMAASGRTALFTLLCALKTSADRTTREEVLLPAYTCPALVKVILDAELKPCPVDVLPKSLDFAPGELQSKLSERTLAVIYVHPFGLPMPVGRIVDDCHQVGAVVIEDAAQAMGACYGRRPVGTWGDFGLFSLGPGKPLSTGGGGIVTANHPHTVSVLEEAWNRLPPPSRSRSAVAQLRLAALSTAFHPAGWWLASKLGAQRFGNQEMSWGYQSLQLSASQAQVGRTLLRQLNQINAQRSSNANTLLRLLATTETVCPPVLALGAQPTYLRLPLLAQSESMRDGLQAALSKAGIGAGKMYGRSLDEIFAELPGGPFEGAHTVARRLLTLPTHHFMSSEDLEKIGRLVRAYGVAA